MLRRVVSGRRRNRHAPRKRRKPLLNNYELDSANIPVANDERASSFASSGSFDWSGATSRIYYTTTTPLMLSA